PAGPADPASRQRGGATGIRSAPQTSSGLFICASVPGPGGSARRRLQRAVKRSPVGSDLPDVGGLQSLGALGHLELVRLTLGEALKAVGLDGARTDEDVLARFPLDEAEALRIVEPLHGSLCHRRSSSVGER